MTTDIFNDIKLALVAGNLPLNKTIHGLVKTIRELSPRHERDNDHDDVVEDLISHCYQEYYRKKWLHSYDKTKSSWGYYINKMVYYTLLDYRKSLIRRNSYYDEPSYDKLPDQEMTGVTDDDYFMYSNEGYEMDTPEDYHDAHNLYDIILSILPPEIAECKIQGLSNRQCADQLGLTEKQFSRKYKKYFDELIQRLQELDYDVGEIVRWRT